MDFCHNISNYPPEQHLLCSLDDILSGHSMEQDDVGMEWLSNFVEDCLSSSGNCMPPPLVKPQCTTSIAQVTTNTTAQPKPKVKEPNSILQLVVPCKARSKRKRSPTCWLAETGLIFPKKCTTVYSTSADETSNGQGQGRKCTHCLSQRTPQWRAGPKGPKTLCNACGVRYKSGRLLPEYRPAKSPTFVTHKHSNSHKKVLEMRSTTSFSS
ncbi:zinc finger, NHR/GATA-type [Artemisia annua]|uniref:Zinc finger, NHR/GATA-type n=1 Tax=Artemisia annua TaxID=35608 RepID=A0A2U1Q3D8_ARTAN|nr:zinc finger, NHR/GATA-type [Artemisia annua]